MTAEGRAAARTITGSLAVLLLVALAARMAGVFTADRLVVDVLRYHKVATHVLDVSWNPYEAPRLYPYPPVWIGFEALALWLSRLLGGGFPVLVKVPVVLADLGIVWLLAQGEGARTRFGEKVGAWSPPRLAAWVYAVHPVALLVTGFHGQFDSLPVLAVLLALFWHGTGRFDASALALAAGIATKSYPVLLLPFFVLSVPGGRRAVRYALLATLPVAALLLPFAIANPLALLRELFGYGGIADFGWIGLVRAIRWTVSGSLPRSEAAHWPLAVAWGKSVFLAAWLAIAALYVPRRREGRLPEAALAVLLAFLGLYGAVSAQYLLWVVPLGLLLSDRHSFTFGASATVSLLGFYFFLAPGVLSAPAPGTPAPELAGRVWALGLALLLPATLLWLGSTVRRLATPSSPRGHSDETSGRP